MSYNNSRITSLLTAFFVGLATTLFLLFVNRLQFFEAFITGLLTFLFSFLLIFLSLEFLVFREIKRMYALMDRLKNKNFDIPRKHMRAGGPLRAIKSEIFNLAARKQEEIEELRRMEIYRREFLADLSHEFKTPVFAAQGFIHTLLDGAVSDKKVRDKFLKKAAKSLDSLEALIRDLLTVAELEAGQIKMNYKNFDIAEAIADVLEQMEVKARKRTVYFEFDQDKYREMIVHADEERIKRVIGNLVSNAIKYGREKGKVTVELKEEKDFVRVSVKDNGPGIGEEHLDRIFDRFYRVEKSRSKGFGGTGLGLAIVKHTVEAHGSTVDVSSLQDKETVFSFNLKKA